MILFAPCHILLLTVRGSLQKPSHEKLLKCGFHRHSPRALVGLPLAAQQKLFSLGVQ